jgi:lysophospholipase L1-like esterase
MYRSILFVLFIVLAPVAVFGQFTPLTTAADDSENHTGVWFASWMTLPDPVIPIETLVQATKEAVTGGVALKVIVQPGSIGRIMYETDLTNKNLTFYVKASANTTMRVFRPSTNGSQTFNATTAWHKIDIALTAADWMFSIELNAAAASEMYYIIDRIGYEDVFTAENLSGVTTGPDTDISTSALVAGASNLSATKARLAAKTAFKVVALGDSITEGAQIKRGNAFDMGGNEDKYKYSSAMARYLELHFGYTSGALAVYNFGHGGWTAQQAIDNNLITTEVLTRAGPNDLVILQFGGNDLAGGATIAEWKADMVTLIGQLHTAGITQIIMMGTTSGAVTFANSAAISTTLNELVTEQNVGIVDTTKFSTFRGSAFGWAYLSNEYHPDAEGHMQIGRIASTLFTDNHYYVVSGTPDSGSDAIPPAVTITQVKLYGKVGDDKSTPPTVNVDGTVVSAPSGRWTSQDVAFTNPKTIMVSTVDASGNTRNVNVTVAH